MLFWLVVHGNCDMFNLLERPACPACNAVLVDIIFAMHCCEFITYNAYKDAACFCSTNQHPDRHAFAKVVLVHVWKTHCACTSLTPI